MEPVALIWEFASRSMVLFVFPTVTPKLDTILLLFSLLSSSLPVASIVFGRSTLRLDSADNSFLLAVLIVIFPSVVLRVLALRDKSVVVEPTAMPADHSNIEFCHQALP